MDAKIERMQSTLAMNQIARLLACLGIATSCQRSAGSTATPVPEPYPSDIENLCDVVARSGADQLPVGERALTIANWLSAHLQTQEAHEYLIRIQPLSGEPKATALEAEARRVGLARCALADEWRTAAPPAN
ncbi:MAG TPA: hypothetical protein VHN14_02060 [Kofleriaceae bacterium]|jgi:hypothetical protein|nr:hypothetical protein [Kofleriaceae bacterium]